MSDQFGAGRASCGVGVAERRFEEEIEKHYEAFTPDTQQSRAALLRIGPCLPALSLGIFCGVGYHE